MDNTKYNNTDLKNGLNSLILKRGVSKEGSEYYYLNLDFKNGYEKRVFLNNESLFAIRDVCNLLETEGIMGD